MIVTLAPALPACDDRPVVIPGSVLYVCEKCPAIRRVHVADTRVPMHNCAGRALMSVPLILQDSGHHVRLVEREDYVNGDDVQTDAEGTPWMRAEVETADTVNVWVYAPVAHTSSSAH